MSSKRKHFVDDGWAIWVDGDDTSTIYLHEWLDPTGKNYVDVGIHIGGVQGTHSLNVYIPFHVDADEVEDLSDKLAEPRVFQALFASSGLIDYQKNSPTSEMAYHGKTVDLVHLKHTGFTITPLSCGSMLTVSLDQLNGYLENNVAHFLFRLPHKSLDEIFLRKMDMEKLSTRFYNLVTSPVVLERYGYSIRINEGRLLPDEINRISAFHQQKLKRVVVTISLHESFQVNDANCYRIRRLEERFYERYMPAGYNCQDTVTYQWNQSRERNLRRYYNFYFDITHESLSRASLLLYLILIVVLGTMGNAMWDVIKHLLNFWI